MNDQILPRMLEILRSSSMPLPAQLELSLRIAEWTKLSGGDDLPEDLRLTPGLIADAERLSNAEHSIASMGGLLGQAFTPTWTTDLSAQPVRAAFELALRAAEAGVLDQLDATDAITYLPASSFGTWFLPGDVCKLLVALGDIQAEESVYVPWDAGGQLAARAKADATNVHVESPIRSAIPALVGLLTDRPFEIRFSDPIDMPSYIADGRPEKFDVAIGFPPMGQRHPISVIERDWFGRFRERTQSGSVLAVRHLLAQTKRRVVVAVPNSLTFSPGAERSLRDDLVRNGMVRAVIAMPSGLLESTNIAFTILILEPSGGRNAIQFVDASQGALLTARAKGPTIPIVADSLIELVKSGSDAEFSRVVSIEEVLANEAQLQPSRYLIPKAARELQAKLEGAHTVVLGEVVTTARPMPVTKDQPATAVGEIGAADIPAHGYISKPGRTVHIDDSPKNRQNFLRPLDLVLIVKGSVGKVGIIPIDVPPPGPGGWVAGQSAIILRVTDDRMDPRALVLQLRSPFGQQLLKQIVSGATIPLIQIRELMRLSVLLPDRATSAAAGAALEKEDQLQQQIGELQKKLAEVTADLWPVG